MKLTLESLPMYCEERGDCLLWKLGLNNRGYPQARLENSNWLVRRYVFTRLLGRDIPKGRVLSSRCGDTRCLSPSCIYAATRGGVQKLCYAVGKRSRPSEYLGRIRALEKRGMTKATHEIVREIRSAPAELTHTELAQRYGVSHKTIASIRKGKSWRIAAPASSAFSWRP